MAGVRLGERVDKETLRHVLSDEKIFGVNLCDMGMADTVAGYLNEMLARPGRCGIHCKNILGVSPEVGRNQQDDIKGTSGNPKGL